MSPLTSIVRRAPPPTRPMATIRPAAIATSASRAGAPVPSQTRPPRRSRSTMATAGLSKGAAGGQRRAAPARYCHARRGRGCRRRSRSSAGGRAISAGLGVRPYSKVAPAAAPSPPRRGRLVVVLPVAAAVVVVVAIMVVVAIPARAAAVFSPVTRRDVVVADGDGEDRRWNVADGDEAPWAAEADGAEPGAVVERVVAAAEVEVVVGQLRGVIDRRPRHDDERWGRLDDDGRRRRDPDVDADVHVGRTGGRAREHAQEGGREGCPLHPPLHHPTSSVRDAVALQYSIGIRVVVPSATPDAEPGGESLVQQPCLLALLQRHGLAYQTGGANATVGDRLEP